MNCAAIPSELIESELFGHEKGAFTGAHRRVIGKFETAHQGTIFLDEIGDMGLPTQAKVLRIIEDGEFSRVGGQSSIKVDCRIIVATNKNLAEEIRKGAFRDDLYHRINVFQIHVPPLRERKTDIPLLAAHFLKEYCLENGFPIKVLSREAEVHLCDLAFAGNIRELKNTIERAVIVCKNDTISLQDIRQRSATAAVIGQDIFALAMDLVDAKNDLEKKYIETQLALNDWNIAKTAEQLGVQRSNLSRRIKQLKIEKP
jgi:transcriptional regulator with GAF, ATPase, and Fis domain